MEINEEDIRKIAKEEAVAEIKRLRMEFLEEEKRKATFSLGVSEQQALLASYPIPSYFSSVQSLCR